ncbi:MAG: CsbD family protein [Actinomycetota bacterium]|nr:CsbD family protein [Actinomycetota bacterium]
MSAEDKMRNQAQNLKGEAKEKVGDVTGDDSLQAEGQADQSKSDLKQAGEKVKDAFKD